MTDIEQKALALLNEVAKEMGHTGSPWNSPTILNEALYRAIEQHEALEAANERLREALEMVWKEATTMRNASKLVGPYPNEPANNRVWARSMYHAGKKLHELIKPVRAALGERGDD